MSEWVASTVGGVTAYQRAGGTPSATVDRYYGGDINFATIEDITNSGRFLVRTEKTLTEEGLRCSAAWLIKEPHVLYSMYATVGKPIVNCIPCATNQAIIALKPTDQIDSTFLYYQLLFIRPEVYKYTAQTTQSNLNAGSVKRLPIRYPKDKRHQQKIAAILTSLDAAIEKTEALLEKHQQVKAGLMHDLFTRGVLPNGQLRPPLERAPELYQRTTYGWAPKEWMLSTLRGCLAEGACNGIYKPAALIGSGVLLVGQTALTTERSVEFGLGRRAEVTRAELHRFGLQGGDILVARVFATVEGVGVPALVPEPPEPAVFESNMMRLRANVDRVRPRILFEWLKGDPARRHVSSGANASNQTSINQTVLYPMTVPVPSLMEQDRMLAAVERSTAQLSAEVKSLAKLRMERLGLMQDLLTGKVPVKVSTPACPPEAAGMTLEPA